MASQFCGFFLFPFVFSSRCLSRLLSYTAIVGEEGSRVLIRFQWAEVQHVVVLACIWEEASILLEGSTDPCLSLSFMLKIMPILRLRLKLKLVLVLVLRPNGIDPWLLILALVLAFFIDAVLLRMAIIRAVVSSSFCYILIYFIY